MKDVFTKKMFLGFLGPSVIAAFGLALSNIADSLVIGIHIGETGLAAIAITLPIYMIYAVFYVGIGTGGTIAFSKLLGEGKKDAANSLFNMLMELSIVIGLIFMTAGIFFTEQVLAFLGTVPADGEVYEVSYSYARLLLLAAPVFFLNTPLYGFIRSDDCQKLSTIGFVIGNVLDVVMNVVLVIFLNMGVRGAVVSTIIGQTVSVLIYVYYFFKKETSVKLRLTKPQFKTIIQALTMGISMSGQYIFQFLFILVTNHILLDLSGEPAVAVLDVVFNVSYLGLFLHTAAGEALQPLASTFFGEKNLEAQRVVKTLALKFGLVAGSIFLVFIAFLAPVICRVYQINKELGSIAILIYCLSGIIGGMQIILCYFYQSTGKEKLAFTISLMRNLVLIIPFAYLFAGFGVKMIWWMFPATELLSLMILLMIRNLRFFAMNATMVDEKRILNILIVSNEKEVKIPVDEIEEFCGNWGANFKQTYYVTMVVEEICGAIVNNAFCNTTDIYLQITLIAYESGLFELHIRDNASTFNPFEMQSKTISIEDSEEELDGLGVMMVKKKAKTFYYRRYQGFNTLTVCV